MTTLPLASVLAAGGVVVPVHLLHVKRVPGSARTATA